MFKIEKKLDLKIAVPFENTTLSESENSDENNNDILKEIEQLQLELNELKNTNSQLQNQIREVKSGYQTEIDMLQNTIQAEIDANVEMRNINSENVSQLLIEIEKLKKNIVDLKNSKIELNRRNDALNKAKKRGKRKNDHLQHSLEDMKEKLKETERKFQVSSNVFEQLDKCASEVPKEFFTATSKRAGGGHNRSYHPALKKFALTLHLCSPKAYR